MTARIFRFDAFRLDPRNRQLTRDGVQVDLNNRYFDVLALLVREDGRLVSKDRFFEEVWQGVPVTDEALTQCIKTLRKQLGDDAANPRYIETVPKHGYRFIAVVNGPEESVQTVSPATASWRPFWILGTAAMAGGAMAGAVGGLIYGLIGAFEPVQPGVGAASTILVLMCISLLIGLLAGAGVGFGIAASGFARENSLAWSIGGGAAGGLVVGAFVKLLGLDAFNLLFGQTPGDITGAAEGGLLGGAVGFAFWFASRQTGRLSLRYSLAAAGMTGIVMGALIPLFGGRLMGGSLDMLARQFPQSRLRFDQVGHLFGESDFGPFSQIIMSGMEGLLFAACVVGAMIIAWRKLSA